MMDIMSGSHFFMFSFVMSSISTDACCYYASFERMRKVVSR